MAMKENTRKVFDYLKDNTDKDLTAADVAHAHHSPYAAEQR